MPFDAAAPTTSTDLLILQQARDELVRCGWTQGVTGDSAKCEPVCMLGALGVPRTVEAVTAWCSLAVLLGFAEMADAFKWNDAPGRTQAEVLARFDAAIAKLAAAQ